MAAQRANVCTHQSTVHSRETLQLRSCFAIHSSSTTEVRLPCLLLLLLFSHIYVITCPAATHRQRVLPTYAPLPYLLDFLSKPWLVFKLPATHVTLFGMRLLHSHLCRNDLAGQNHSESRLAVHHHAQDLVQLIVQLME